MDSHILNVVYATIIDEINTNKASIPRIPSHTVMIDRIFRDDNSSLSDLARVIEAEPSLALRLIQVANSAFYGSVSTIKTTRNALTRIGMKAARNMALALAVRDTFRSTDDYVNVVLNNVWTDSIDVAIISAVLAKKFKMDIDEAFLSGIIHQVGFLAVAGYWLVHGQHNGTNKVHLFETIAPLLTCSLGSYVLMHWKFPVELNTSVHSHCDPFGVENETLTIADLVIVAKEYCKHHSTTFDVTPSVMKCGLTYAEMKEMASEFTEYGTEIRSVFS